MPGSTPTFSPLAAARAPGAAPQRWSEPRVTALLVFADGMVIEGSGVGATGEASGEICFNTAMTGYEEILTDPSYAGQIVTFTFPHIGNVGVNDEDIETVNMASASGVRGVVLAETITEPSNGRAGRGFDEWLVARGIVGISGVDTRALTALIRDKGMANAVIAHHQDGVFDLDALAAKAKALPSMTGLDLVPLVASFQRHAWEETEWAWPNGYGHQTEPRFHVVAIDYGVKRNILRLLAARGCKVTVVPPTMKAEDLLALRPDGVFLADGPGDPAATGEYAVPVIKRLIDERVPTFGICLGHQIIGARNRRQDDKDEPGPPRRQSPGEGDGHRKGRDRLDEPRLCGRCGLLAGKRGADPYVALRWLELRVDAQGPPAFSVQHHPESSPRPRDSH